MNWLPALAFLVPFALLLYFDHRRRPSLSACAHKKTLKFVGDRHYSCPDCGKDFYTEAP